MPYYKLVEKDKILEALVSVKHRDFEIENLNFKTKIQFIEIIKEKEIHGGWYYFDFKEDAYKFFGLPVESEK